MPYQIIWSWYTGRWWVGCYVWYSDEGTGRGPSPPRPLLAVPNVTAHPSTASVPITVLLYNDPLLCGFNVPIKGLTASPRCVRLICILLTHLFLFFHPFCNDVVVPMSTGVRLALSCVQAAWVYFILYKTKSFMQQCMCFMDYPCIV